MLSRMLASLVSFDVTGSLGEISDLKTLNIFIGGRNVTREEVAGRGLVSQDLPLH